MNKTIVRCRCGHQVLSKEVLRTDLYERRAPGDAGREYVYVKYRCRRCKRMGEAFVAENRWDWGMLEAEPNEMNEVERDRFLDEEPITQEELIDFHRDLQNFSLSDLAAMNNDATEIEISEAEIAAETEIEASDTNVSPPEMRAEPRKNDDGNARDENSTGENLAGENAKSTPKNMTRIDPNRADAPPVSPNPPEDPRNHRA